MSDLLLTYYGDDFTGSTDVMEALTLGGVPTVLFLEPPSPERLQRRFADVKVVGMAGVSRSMTPAQMDRELPPKFEHLKQLGAPLFHYKICSTFDSSPEVGSIGHAIDIGVAIFSSSPVPLVVGAPALKRYVVFGNLFATAGTHTYRLDRHPTMSKHPITPMRESDLRRHLAKQTDKSIALLDVLALEREKGGLDESFAATLADGSDVVLFDTLNDTHLPRVGRLIWEQRGDRTLFAVGSSGLEYALTAYWQETGLTEPSAGHASPGPVSQLVVMSGSAAPATAEQIRWALEKGFVGIRLNTARLVDSADADAERASATRKALAAIEDGRSVVLYTARGPDDPAISATRRSLEELNLNVATGGQRLGKQQGRILRTILTESGLRRACVAGGDTSGYVATQLGIFALEMIVPIAPGSPLCRASATDPTFDGLEIALKGGQVGGPHYFGQIQRGHA